MSEMDRILNSKRDKETIYEIYRACRLCGAGAGYKMPIIQNVVDLDDSNDVELKIKIRECVQIEVHHDDKMPPLICELCVDKVNDFYEFLEMCRQTNKKTRLRLGLPPQSLPTGALDAGDCILGLTEPVYVNEDSEGEPLTKQKKNKDTKVKVKKEPEPPAERKVLKVKLEKSPVESETRPLRFRSKRCLTPPRITRLSKSNADDNISLSKLQDRSSKNTSSPSSTPKVSQKPAPKSILKKEQKEDSPQPSPRLKRTRDKEPVAVKGETPVKKVKIAVKTSTPVKSPPKPSPKTSPRVSKPPPKPATKRPPSPPPPPQHKCAICAQVKSTSQALSNHLRSHIVGFTNPKLACDPCGEWFRTPEESALHHKRHRTKSKPYACRRCTAEFKLLADYDEHFGNNQCISWDLVPDEKCDVCWHLFPTHKLFMEHKCLGEDHRPGGKCGKCNRSYALLKNLKKHEITCTAKKKGELIVDPELLARLRPIQVRVSRCDPLLGNIKQEHYDISSVSADFGLDKNCVYPYISSVCRLDGMVAIKQEIKDEFLSEANYIHWDSESESDEEINLIPTLKKKRVNSLATLTLKTLFSQRCLGRVPRKRRRVKIEKEKDVFDTLVNEEDDVSRNIFNIIDNLRGLSDNDDKNDIRFAGNDNSENVSLTDSVNLLEGCNMDKNDQSYNVDKDKHSANDKNNDFDSLKDDEIVEKQNDFDSLTDDGNDSVDKSNDNDVSTNINDTSDKETDERHKNGSNNDLSSSKVSSLDGKVMVNNGTNNNIRNNTEVNSKDFNVNDNSKVENNVSDVNLDSDSDGKHKSDADLKNVNESDAKIDGKSDVLNNDDTKNSIDAPSLLNDKTTNDKIIEINKNDFNDKSKSQSDLNENLNQNSKISDPNSKTNANCIKNDENFDTKAVSVIVNNQKSNKTDAEVDDDSLMAALDAEIGDGTIKNDKIALEDLILKNNDKPELAMPEEFSFDNLA